jgi:hypothetical protein
MTGPFTDFDFRLLDDPDFREDSVREELVVPLLSSLGYSASGPHRIIRSRPLQHPYVYIGTVKKPITIVPDYLLQVDGRNAWILDAKAPDEVIDSGKNVEQAFSYAIHRDVRVPLYALCNGRRLTVFDVSRWPSILDVALDDLAGAWPMVLGMLGTKAAWPEGRPPGFLPDFGLALRKAGLTHDQDGKKIWNMFTSVPVRTIARIEDGLYSVTAPYVQEESAHMLTLDFGSEGYAKFLAALPTDLRERVRVALTRQPYQVALEDSEAPLITVVADPGDKVHTNANESYCPFIAEEFVREPR